MRSEGEEWSVMCPRPTVRVFAFLFMVLFAAVHIYGALEPVDEAGSSQELVFSKGNYSPTARKLLANISSTDSSYTLAIKPNLYTLSRHISDKAHKTENNYGDGEPGDGSGYDNNRQNGSPDSGDGNNNNGGDGSPDGGADDNNGGDGSMNRVGTVPPCSKDSILVYQGATSPLPNGIPTYTVEIQNVCLTESCRISDIHLSCGWFSSARLVNPRVFRRIGYDDCLVNDGGAVTPGEVLSFQYANTFQYPLSVSSVSC